VGIVIEPFRQLFQNLLGVVLLFEVGLESTILCIPSIVSMSLRDSKTTPQTFKKFTRHADTLGSVTVLTDSSGHSHDISMIPSERPVAVELPLPGELRGT
jgi:hypothetical protein